MSAAFALFILAQAATACAPAGEVRLPGGATLVRPVGAEAPLPVVPLGPATGIEKSDALRHTGADTYAKTPEPAAQPPEVCDAEPIENV